MNSSSSVENKKLEGKLDALVNLVTQLAMNQKFASAPVARVCGLCSSPCHHIDLCPSLQQSGVNEQPEAYQQQQQQQRQQATEALPQPSLEELMRKMTIQNMQFQQETRASIQSLTNQMGQMATQLNQAQSQNSDKLPSQTVQNLKNMSAITLRSGKQIEVPPPVAAPTPEPVKFHFTPKKEDEIIAQKRKLPDQGANKNFHAGGPSSSNSDLQQPPIPLPFPPRAIPNKKMEEVEKEILETFRKVEVNIPLLDAIKQIPR
ncbi:hypothetical protein HKD37_13G035655 [Glycine soja]